MLGRVFSRRLSSAASSASETLPEAYPLSVSVLHWLMAPTLMGAVGSVVIAQSLDKKDTEFKENYGKWMWRHKSLGLLTGMLVVPRVANRVLLDKAKAKMPAHLPGILGSAQEHVVKMSHTALYGFLVFMPLSGIAMGYYSGFGLPFFFTKFIGASKKNQNKFLAGKAYSMHAAVGYYGKYLIPMHVAGAGAHLAKGQAVFSRINPMPAVKAINSTVKP
eukprot:gb/GEZN01010699.1/.p1 GENE.gb/GEZN01010699.1/~~gb/GEZN01010699.1/.p1  ORF type:complete len:219 (-),score=30.52 gb/GEZN01010699.1/:212-868(-)